MGLEGVQKTLLIANSMRTAEEESKAREQALREDREERAALSYSEEEKLEAAKRIGINTAGAWGRKSSYGSFTPVHDPPDYGSIHYWLAYGREVLLEAKRRKAFTSELRCAVQGLNSFAANPRFSVHHMAAHRIHEELTGLLKGYTRLTR